METNKKKTEIKKLLRCSDLELLFFVTFCDELIRNVSAGTAFLENALYSEAK